MNGSSAVTQSPRLLAVALLSSMAFGPAGLDAQDAVPAERTALGRYYPYVEDLLNALEAAREVVYRSVLEERAEPASEADRRVYERLVRGDLAGFEGLATVAADASGAGAAQGSSRVVPEELVALLDRTDDFRRRLLNLLADPGVDRPEREVEALVQAYLSEAGGSLPPEPTDMSVLSAGSDAGAFGLAYPHLHGLVWAQRWLELAAFEPLLLHRTPEGRQAGMHAVVARFWSMLEEPPYRFPTQMPMAPTIAPNLMEFNSQVAAILENAGMLRERVADVLAAEGVEDRPEALRTVVVGFRDRGYPRVTSTAWRQMASMHGVGNQGGWAIGIIPMPEREPMGMDHRHHTSMPSYGMQ